MVVAVVVCMPQSMRAQTQAEYFIDADPGLGNATTVNVPIGADGTLNFSVPTAGLAPGDHLIGIRAYTTTMQEGKQTTSFGPTITQRVLVKGEYIAQTIRYAEYFWGNDPGFGHGLPIPIVAGQDVSLANIQIPTDGLAAGEYNLSVRAYGSQGWGPTITQRVLVKGEYVAQTIRYAEYFWGDDPGFGHGQPIPIVEGQDVSLANVEIPTNGLTVGEYNLSVRAYGTGGWGPTISQRVIVKGEHIQQQVLYAEYFWNEDPGFGLGTPILLTPGEEVNLENLQIPSFEAHGSSTLYLRAYGTGGWGPTIAADVLVDAEGNYTLNANAETSMENRNYQSLTDIFDDFADRGVGDNVNFTVTTTETTYSYDASTDERLAQMAQIANNLSLGSTSRDERTVAFTAAEGSGNALAITTTDDGLPAVVELFSRFSTTNVALTINGTAYDFSATATRHQTICTGEKTEAVALSSVSPSLTMSWEAIPHSGTTISGFVTAGTSDIPQMTLRNSGTQLDSLTVRVTIASGNRTLATYDYTYLVHASVAMQSFTSLTPATGSSLDPGTTMLKWNAIGDAESYQLTISQKALGDDSATPVEQTIETTATEYELNVESGMEYTWTITAIGSCDELFSPEMSFTGRLLADLVVSNITLPEAAQAGNALAVSATITNQGAGATTEKTWTDRLYYTVNSTKFDDAVLLAEQNHSGNLAVGESYEVTFNVTTPMEDSGQLRVFVVTDAENKVMESNADNNRTMSSTVAELRPFYMNSDDLAALRKFYNDFGGADWNGEAWDINSTIIKGGNWSGVSFDSDGCVTAINLQGRGLSGVLSATTSVALPRLTTLTLGRNALTGDAAAFMGASQLPQLTSLDLSYNQLDELSDVLPSSITSLNLTSQHRTYGNNKLFPGIDAMEPRMLNVSSDMTVSLPAIATYNHTRQTFTSHSQLRVYDRNYQTIGTLTWSEALGAYSFAPNGWKVTAAQKAEVVVVPITSSGNNYTNAHNSAYRAQLQFTAGDANLSGWTDVNDVQRTLNYVLDSNNSTTFGLWAANTYDDDSFDADNETINIQDIVCTVNIVLENEEANGVKALNYQNHNEENLVAPVALFYREDRQLQVESSEEIAAFTIQLAGVSASQVKLMLNSREWQMQTRNTSSGVCIAVFSPVGSVLPAGTATTLLRLSGDGEPLRVHATSADATDVPAAVGDSPTGLASVGADGGIRIAVTRDQEMVVSADRDYSATTISVYTLSGTLICHYRFDSLPAGDTRICLNTATDAVVVRVNNQETGICNHKILIRP